MKGCINTALLICAAVLMILLGGCSGRNTVAHDEDEVAVSTVNNQNTADNAASASFSEYAFEFRGASERYMIILRRGSHPDEIAVTVENNRYESRDFVISAPAGYESVFPADQSGAADVVKLITNDMNTDYIPDIMQFVFTITSDELNSTDNAVREASRFYTIDEKGELREIRIVSYADKDNDGEPDQIVRDYLDRTQLYHSEPDKFIYEITVDDSNIYDDEGEPRPVSSRVRIKTLEFDYSVPCLIEKYERIDESNPLYFGYAHWAAANSAAQYFTMSTFSISDWENYVEKNVSADEPSAYYFRIDDPRFNNTYDLKMYLRSIFTPEEADKIFSEAPQHYENIDGSLYGIVGQGDYDYTLGTLTFSGMTIAKDRMVYFSRQEKFDETGRFNGYTDGGNFVIEKGADDLWRVSTYRYPYSLN